jgi:hypothetical protein
VLGLSIASNSNVGLTVYSYPLHDVDVLWEHDDRFEVALDKSGFDKGAAKVQWLLTSGCR